MKLTTTEKLVLRIIAQDEDYERLNLVLSELKGYFPGNSDEKALEIAKTAVRSLIAKGLIEIFRREVAERAEYEPLPQSEYGRALDERNCWFWNDAAPNYIGAAPTKEGQRVYESFCDISQ